ncbi:hypothetical protein SH1V18_41280 [Vallitalea longa]|uniref:Uncharacterized protein n=1 Tax=Vallitalea longa TaxID=2936439 RepID=A0A9W5YI22_9FIRM|nr:hypothetical protein [Vallitalea longa]GKX31648.1 hypothetical protein SH1V18_41280 [Vallitalea longa]
MEPNDYNNNFTKLNKMLQLIKQNSQSTNLNESRNNNSDFDTIVNSNKMNIIKAAIPYMNLENQKKIALFVKLIEFINTMNLYNNHSINEIPALNKTNITKRDMLMALRPSCSDKNKQLIDILLNVNNLKSMMTSINNKKAELIDNNNIDGNYSSNNEENLNQEELIKKLQQLMKE